MPDLLWSCLEEQLLWDGAYSCIHSCSLPYAEHGCTDMITYYHKGEHQELCPHETCYSPEPGCGFAVTTVVLLNHFTSQQKWPMTSFKYYLSFVLTAKPGPHVLRAEDGNFFLLNVVLPSPLYTISLVHIPSRALESCRFRCSVGVSCWKGHYQLSSLDAITSSLLFDGLPKTCFCFVPRSSTVLNITIDTELMYDDEGEPKEEETDDDDDDDSYDRGGGWR